MPTHHSATVPPSASAASSPPSASSGSPRSRDPEATKSAILEAAERLFLDKGYADTAVSEIAERANVTKSLIYHHFGSKEQLWNEIKTTRMHEYIEAQTALFAAEPDVDVVRASVVTYFRFLRRHPELLRLNAWMELEGPQPGNPALDALTAAGTNTLRTLQRQGAFRDDVDVTHLSIMFVGLAEFWLTNRKRIGHALRYVDPTDEVDWDQHDRCYIDSVADVLLQGLLAKPCEGRGTDTAGGDAESNPPPCQ